MQTPESEPFFLLDESLSSGIVSELSRTTGIPIATVWNEWPGRDLSFNRLRDEQIIPHLGAKASHRAVWITGDWNAHREHRELIVDHRISPLWLRGQGGRSLTKPEQLLMLGAVMETVRRLVVESDVPVYLRVRLESGDGYRPALERLQGTLLDTPLRWEPVSLE